MPGNTREYRYVQGAWLHTGKHQGTENSDVGVALCGCGLIWVLFAEPSEENPADIHGLADRAEW